MKWHKVQVEIFTNGKGLYPVTSLIENQIHKLGVQEGMCYLFIPHTSASMIISESYDPSAKVDIENFYELLAPENQHWHQHTLEGKDDSPSHMRSSLTNPSLTIPIDDNRLGLGTWQGIFLFEHRSRPHHRIISARFLEVN